MGRPKHHPRPRPVVRMAHCHWCARAVPVTDKGNLAVHPAVVGRLGACIGAGWRVAPSLRTAPRPIKGYTQRNARRRGGYYDRPRGWRDAD